MSSLPNKTFRICLLFISLFAALGTQAQDSLGTTPFAAIRLNFQKHSIDPPYLPFDVPFRLYAVVPDSSTSVDRIEVTCYQVKKWPRGEHGEICIPVKLHKSCKYCDDSSSKYVEEYVVTLKRDLFSNDTLYADVNIPLRPMKSYGFKLKVIRRVSAAEDKEIDLLLRPIINKYIVQLYVNNVGDPAGNTMGKILLNEANLSPMIDEISDSIVSYYAQKRIPIPKADIYGFLVNDKMRDFIKKYFLDLLVDRQAEVRAIRKLMDQMENDLYLGNDTDSPGLNTIGKHYIWDMPLLKYLYGHSGDFVIKRDSAASAFLGNVLLRYPQLNLALNCSPSDLYQPTLYKTNAPTSKNIRAYLDVITAFSDSCFCFRKLLVDIKSDSALWAKLQKLNPGGQNEAQKEMAQFSDEFYWDVVKLQEYLQAYYGTDTLYEKQLDSAKFNLKTELTLNFQDEGVGLTSADFVTRGAWFIIADIGFAYINTYPTAMVRPYVGVNFNFWPVNRQASYSLLRSPNYPFWENIARSLSVTVGLTVFNTFGPKDRYQELLGNTGSLMTGLALRLSDGIRVNGGMMWAYIKNANPLLDKKTMGGTGYASLSIDLSLKKWLGGIVKSFF